MSSDNNYFLPKIKPEFGSHHPINFTKDHIVNLLMSYGFEIVDGPEIETEEFNFDIQFTNFR